jgi:hypothetical protein
VEENTATIVPWGKNNEKLFEEDVFGDVVGIKN